MLKDIFLKNKIIPQSEFDKDKVVIKCFMHSEQNGKSLVLDFKRNFYRCFGKCQKSGSLLELILDQNIELDTNCILDSNEAVKNDSDIIEIKEFNDYISKFSKNNYYNDYKLEKYLKERKLDKRITDSNYISFSNFDKRIWIPIFFDKKCYGYTKRVMFDYRMLYQEIMDKYGINDEIQVEKMFYSNDSRLSEYQIETFNKVRWDIKYTNTKNLPKQNLIYEPLTNDYNKFNKILIVEGVFDSLYANQYGYNAFAILGGNVSNNKVISKDIGIIEYILNIAQEFDQEIILCFDNDEAGRKFHNKFNMLSQSIFKKVDLNILNPEFKDLESVNKEQLDYLISEANYF